MKTYWKVDKHIFSVKEVSEKEKDRRDKLAAKGYSQFAELYFDAKEDAVLWQIERGKAEIKKLQTEQKRVEKQLNDFIKKHS